MESVAQSSPPRKRSSRRRFWRHHFLARAALLALSCGVAGSLLGALIGVTNSSGSPAQLLPVGAWWGMLFVVALICGVMTLVLGLGVGMVAFALIALASSRWSASRRWRFAHGLSKRVFLPVMGSTFAVPLLAGALWSVRQGNYHVQAAGLSDVLYQTPLLTVPLSTGLFIALLAHSSKGPRRNVQTGRLLPLD